MPSIPDPSPEEIRLRCIEIQSEWTPEQLRRRESISAVEWSVPGVRSTVKEPAVQE